MLHVLEIFSYDSNKVKSNSSNGKQSALETCPILLVAINSSQYMYMHSSSNVSLKTSPTLAVDLNSWNSILIAWDVYFLTFHFDA